MRTTLKRGMGRATAVNGNGRAVFPPGILPPDDVVEPMRRYRPPPPRSMKLGAKVFGWIVLALLVVVSGLAGGLYLYSHETLNALSDRSPTARVTARDLKGITSPSEPATALLIGYDKRAGADAAAGSSSRSDTVMLVRADPTNKTLSMLSFPRDLIVPIYCNGADVPRTQDRINAAWSMCGERGTLDTLQHLTGVPVNYVITVDFHGFKLLVNKLRGVYLDVDHRYINTQGGSCSTCFAKIDLEPGYQKLDGQQALDFVRFRHTDSDLYRLARQQNFLEALKDRFSTSLSILDIPKIIGAIKGSVSVLKAGGGAVGMGEIQSYAGLGYHLPAGHQFRVSIQNVQDCGVANAEICAAPADIQAAVDSFEHPDVSLPKRANAVALGHKPQAPKQPKLKASQITTLVLNGTTISHLARDTSDKLKVAGYHTLQLPPTVFADAPTKNYIKTIVYYDSVQPNAKAAANELKAAFGPPTVVAPMTSEIAAFAQEANNPLTVLIVGTSFNGRVVNPEQNVAPTPPRQPAAVRSDPGLTLTQLQQVRSKLPFPVMVPRTIERSSTLAALDPVRAFKPIAHRHELVLTFAIGGESVYWSIIETDWNDAPILRHPTEHIRLGGRPADLYTTGGHIHLIVLHDGGATYWVFNTLRDELSNETMLAITKGLRPLG